MAARVDQANAEAGATGARLNLDLIERRLVDMEITKADLAEMLAMDPATLWRWWEKGAMPKITTVAKLADVLGVSVNNLIGQGSPTPRPAPAPTTPKPAPAPTSPSKPKAAA